MLGGGAERPLGQRGTAGARGDLDRDGVADEAAQRGVLGGERVRPALLDDEGEGGGVAALAKARGLGVEQSLREERVHEGDRARAEVLEHAGADEPRERVVGGVGGHAGERGGLGVVEVDAEDRTGPHVRRRSARAGAPSR